VKYIVMDYGNENQPQNTGCKVASCDTHSDAKDVAWALEKFHVGRWYGVSSFNGQKYIWHFIPTRYERQVAQR
jgi:hypothetical protein